MMNPSRSELVTKLFVIALYHWHIGDKFNARTALDTALFVLSVPHKKQVA